MVENSKWINIVNDLLKEMESLTVYCKGISKRVEKNRERIKRLEDNEL